MRSNTWRALFLLSLTLMLVSTAMDAQAARRSSLAGNQFINDPDDMFAFPQLIMKYTDRVIIDMGQPIQKIGYDGTPVVDDQNNPVMIQRGNGSVIFGDQYVFNFNTGRGDYLNNTASWAMGGYDRPMDDGMEGNGIPIVDPTTPYQGNAMEWWDLGFATDLDGTPIGFNLSWASNYEEATNSANPNTTTNTSTSMLSFQVGATVSDIEVAGEVSFGSYKDEGVRTPPLNPSDQNDYSFFNFALLARGDLENIGGLDWRWIGSFATGSTDRKLVVNNASYEKLSSTAFRAAFGPVWGTPKDWEVAAYINFMYLSHDVGYSGVDKVDNDKYLVFPGYNIAMEYYLNSWLVARGGVMSRSVGITKTEPAASPATTEIERKSRDSELMWTLGLGVDKGNWGLDLALEEDNVHTGYLPFNGNQGAGTDHPIAYISAWLAWGEN